MYKKKDKEDFYFRIKVCIYKNNICIIKEQQSSFSLCFFVLKYKVDGKKWLQVLCYKFFNIYFLSIYFISIYLIIYIVGIYILYRNKLNNIVLNLMGFYNF